MWFRKPKSTPIAPERRSAGTLYRTRQRLPWPKDRDFRILSIDGGGIRGILPLAVLAGLEKVHLGDRPISDYFDMVVGTSTGGIIALGLGAGYSAKDLLKTYLERGSSVFPDYCSIAKLGLEASQYFFNRCNTKRLGELIDDMLNEKKLWESRVRVCVPAAETRHYEPFIFKTPHHPDYRKDWKEKMAHIARMTAAAPTFFKPVKREDGYEFVDGGIWANNPIMVGIADALSCFDLRREQIRVLSIGCVQDQFKMGWLRRNLGGRLFWASLIFESMHIQSQNAIGQARLIIGGDHVLRLNAGPLDKKIELWDWARCQAELPAMADRLLTEHSQKIFDQFLATPAPLYEPIYTESAPPKEREQS